MTPGLRLATCGNRDNSQPRFGIVEHGTTRPGPIVAGSLIRVEVADTPDNVERAGTIELECGDSVLVVALDVAD